MQRPSAFQRPLFEGMPEEPVQHERVPGTYMSCLRCGRSLRSPESQDRGLGSTCARKSGWTRREEETTP